jgi:hypothetical protein
MLRWGSNLFIGDETSTSNQVYLVCANICKHEVVVVSTSQITSCEPTGDEGIATRVIPPKVTANGRAGIVIAHGLAPPVPSAQIEIARFPDSILEDNKRVHIEDSVPSRGGHRNGTTVHPG